MSSPTLQGHGSNEQNVQDKLISIDSTAVEIIAPSLSLSLLLPRVIPENVVVCYICLHSQEDRPNDKFLFYPGGGCTHSVCVPCLKLWILEGHWSCGLCRGYPWGNAWKKGRERSVGGFRIGTQGNLVPVRRTPEDRHLQATPQTIYSSGNLERRTWMIREQMAEAVQRDPENEELRTRLEGWDLAMGFKMRKFHKKGQRHLKGRELVRVMHTDGSGREHTVFYKDRNDGRGRRLMAKTDTGDGNGIRIRPYYFD